MAGSEPDWHSREGLRSSAARAVEIQRAANQIKIQSADKLLFFCRSFLRALPELFCSWAESSFCRDDTDRKWFRLRSEVQKLYSVSETVTKVYRNGDAGPASTADMTPDMLSCSSMTRGFCFTFEKISESKS